MLYGYFISTIHTEFFPEPEQLIRGIENVDKNIVYDSIFINIEPKYDVSIELDMPLYHITNEVNIKKIFNIGLVPKSKQKLSFHPERVYVINDLEYVKKLITELRKYENKFNYDDNGNKLSINTNYMVLEINNNKNHIFYNDPNAFNKGFYTYDNIDPKDIEIISTYKLEEEI